MIIEIKFFQNIIFNINIFNMIIKINISNYKILINFFYRNKFIFLVNNNIHKYYWSDSCEVNGIYFSFFSVKSKKLFVTNKLKNQKLNGYSSLSNIIWLKKKTSLFKKVSDLNFIFLNKISEARNNFNKNFNYLSSKKKTHINYNYNKFRFKNIDLKKKTKLLFITNRKIVKSLFNIKKNKQHALTRKIKHICNIKKFDNFINLENSLLNLVMRSDFFFSEKDFFWFLKNKFVLINSFSEYNHNTLIKPCDVIQLSNNNYYYMFYRHVFSYLISISFKINRRLWFINKNRRDAAYYRGIKFEKHSENYPKYFESFKYFKKEIPLNLEVDYISMTIILLYYNKKTSQFNFYNYKFFNFYLNRLYNWKFVI